MKGIYIEGSDFTTRFNGYMFTDNSITKETIRKQIIKNLKKKVMKEKKMLAKIR